MAHAQQCQIKLLNRSYDIKCPAANVESLHLAAKKLDELMQRYKHQYPLLDDSKILLLSALEIAHQMVGNQQETTETENGVNALIHSLESRINAVVGKEDV